MKHAVQLADVLWCDKSARQCDSALSMAKPAVARCLHRPQCLQHNASV